MTVRITGDEVGDDVVDGDGNKVGTISAVRDETVYVDPDPGVVITRTEVLDLGQIDEEDGYPLEDEVIEDITDDEVHLELAL